MVKRACGSAVCANTVILASVPLYCRVGREGVDIDAYCCNYDEYCGLVETPVAVSGFNINVLLNETYVGPGRGFRRGP